MEQILLHRHTKPYELFHTILRVTIYIIVTHFLSACKRIHRPPGRRRIPPFFCRSAGHPQQSILRFSWNGLQVFRIFFYEVEMFGSGFGPVAVHL
jgi:hypothetical protein